jgi:hypothetical protein
MPLYVACLYSMQYNALLICMLSYSPPQLHRLLHHQLWLDVNQMMNVLNLLHVKIYDA